MIIDWRSNGNLAGQPVISWVYRPAATGGTAPNTPTGLAITRLARTRNLITWTLNGGAETTVTLEYSTDNSSWTPVDLGAGTTFYEHTGLGTAEVTYYYRVKTSNASGSSAHSSVVSHLMTKVNFFKGQEPSVA